MKKISEFAETVAALDDLTSSISPDAKLVAACERLTLLHQQIDASHQEAKPLFGNQLMAHLSEQERLWCIIKGTPAVTSLGKASKARLILDYTRSSRGLPVLLLRSALKDFIFDSTTSQVV
jgi:hypothetical protein